MTRKFLNNDGQQFHQYQQSKQLLHNFKNWTQKKPTASGIGNPDPSLKQVHKCGGIKPVNGIPIPT